MPASPAPERTDRDLVIAAREGDREAFVVLYQRYFNPVFDFATRMTRDRDEAGDIAQETFIRAMERLGSLNDEQRFKSWVFTIARNETLDRMRRSQRVRPLTTRGEDGEEQPLDILDPHRLADPAATAEANEVVALIWEAAAGLDPRQLSILDLHLRQGLNSAEIAEVLGVSKNNGYVMLNRLKDAVQQTIEAFLLLRQGRNHCGELDALVGAHETTAMSPDLRRMISKHASDCDDCAARKRSLVAPLAVLSALAPIPPTQAFADDVLARILEQSTSTDPSWLTDDEDEDGSTLIDLSSPSSAIAAPASGLGSEFDLGLDPDDDADIDLDL